MASAFSRGQPRSHLAMTFVQVVPVGLLKGQLPGYPCLGSYRSLAPDAWNEGVRRSAGPCLCLQARQHLNYPSAWTQRGVSRMAATMSLGLTLCLSRGIGSPWLWHHSVNMFDY